MRYLNTHDTKKRKQVGELLMSVQCFQQDEVALLQQLITNYKERERLTKEAQWVLNDNSEPTLF